MARILVVDDDPDQLELRSAIFESAGLEVFTAAAAPEAVSLLERHRPESVVLDLCLPAESDGVDLLKRLRGAAGHDPLKILVVSGWTANFRARPESALADHILQKPVRSRDLLKLVNGD